jgi:plasmid stabilization system protein ParE
MAANLTLTPAASRDINAAYDWYEARRPGLGEDFLNELDAAFAALSKNPRTCQVVYRQVRRSLLRRFPYAVFYLFLDAEIVVIAVLHSARNPGLFRERLRH